jgi:hypothetical protein
MYSLPYGQKIIGVAFYDYTLDNRGDRRKASSIMNFYDYLSRRYHSSVVTDQPCDDIENGEKSIYIHCAIILRDDNGFEHTYDYLANGARIQSVNWVDKQRRDHQSSDMKKKPDPPPWNAFRVLTVSNKQFYACKKFLDNEVDQFVSKYDQTDWRPFSRLECILPSSIANVHVQIPISPFRFLPLVGGCIPGQDEWYNCGSFICKALQVAQIIQLEKFVPHLTTSHIIFLAIRDQPVAGPWSISGLNF